MEHSFHCYVIDFYKKNNMTKFSDYFYASIPSVCLAVPIAQYLPNLEFLQGIEKLGIVGILAAGILFFVMERRSFIAKSAEKLETLEDRIGTLETKVTTGNDRVVHLLGEQLDALKEIKNGQAENFSRMWSLTLKTLGDSKNADRTGPSPSEEDVLRPCVDQKQG